MKKIVFALFVFTVLSINLFNTIFFSSKKKLSSIPLYEKWDTLKVDAPTVSWSTSTREELVIVA